MNINVIFAICDRNFGYFDNAFDFASTAWCNSWCWLWCFRQITQSDAGWRKVFLELRYFLHLYLLGVNSYNFTFA